MSIECVSKDTIREYILQHDGQRVGLIFVCPLMKELLEFDPKESDIEFVKKCMHHPMQVRAVARMTIEDECVIFTLDGVKIVTEFNMVLSYLEIEDSVSFLVLTSSHDPL